MDTRKESTAYRKKNQRKDSKNKQIDTFDNL